MKTSQTCTLVFALFAASVLAADPAAPIDWQRAKDLFSRSQNGEKLSAEDQKYLDEAKRQHDAGEGSDKPGGGAPSGIDMARAKELYERAQKGEKLSPEDQKFLDEAKRQHEGGKGSGAPGGIDMARAKELYDREQKGEKLSPEDQKYLDEAKRQREGGKGSGAPGGIDMARAKGLYEREQKGEKLSPEDQKFLDEAKRQMGQGGKKNETSQSKPATPPTEANQTPLTELKSEYKGQDGGLYGGGSNEPAPALAARAGQAAAQIHPLDASGKPATDGKIVLMSIGMSNTTQEFSAFKRIADADPRKAANLVIVDGAQGGRTASAWANNAQPWDEAARRLQAAQVTPAQIQVLWIKQANAGPSAGWPAETDRLRDDLRRVIAQAGEKFPNLRLVFLSSRTYAGYATTRLNPEPYAYEGAFAMRALIREQAADGPVLLWGPYLWTNGEKGRALDGLKWLPADTATDGTHPSASGQQKVADLLLAFFTTDTYAKLWFTK